MVGWGCQTTHRFTIFSGWGCTHPERQGCSLPEGVVFSQVIRTKDQVAAEPRSSIQIPLILTAAPTATVSGENPLGHAVCA